MKKDMKQLIKIYGTNPNRWPAAIRDEADIAFRENPAVTNPENALDAILDSHSVSPPSELLRARILKAARSDAPVSEQVKPLWHQRPIVRRSAIAAAFVICAVIGLQILTPPLVDDTAIWLDAANDLGIEDLYNWVEGTS